MELDDTRDSSERCVVRNRGRLLYREAASVQNTGPRGTLKQLPVSHGNCHRKSFVCLDCFFYFNKDVRPDFVFQ